MFTKQSIRQLTYRLIGAFSVMICVSTYAWAGYQGVWTDSSGKNHYSEPSSSSSSSSSRGRSPWGSSYQAPPPPDDGGLQAEKDAAKASAKEARKYYKQGNWRLAREHAMKWGRNTGLGNVSQSYLYTAATENLWLQIAKDEGRDGLSDSDLTELIRQYESTLSWDPNHRQSKNRLKALKSILDETNRMYDANKAYNEGNAHINAERWDEALVAYRRAAELNPDDPAVYGQMGWLLEERMDYQEAREAYLEAVSKGSKNPKIFHLLANMHHYFKDYELSIAIVEQGLELDSDLASLHNQMADSLEKLYRRAEASAYHKRALELDSDNPYYISNMIDEELITFKNIDRAQELFDRLKILNPDGSNTSHHERQLERYREQAHIDTPGALEVDLQNAKKAQALNPDDPSGFIAEAKALNDMDRREEAIVIYQRALKVDPNNTNAIMAIMKSKQGKGDLVGTMQYANRMLAIDPNNQIAAYARQHIMTWSEDELDAQIVEFENKRQTLLDAAGKSYEEGNLDQALIEAEEILSFDPENVSVQGMKEILVEEIEQRSYESLVRGAARLKQQIQMDVIDPQESSSTSALEQARNVLEHGDKAAVADSLDEAKAESSIGFDTAHTQADPVEAAQPKTSPAKRVKNAWHKFIGRKKSEPVQPSEINVGDVLTEQILALEFKVVELYAAQDREGRSESREMEISKLQQAISDLINQENYDAFMADEALRGGEDISRDMAANAALDLPKDSSVHVTEMSVGGEALSIEDAEKSDTAMDQIRQLAEDDLKQKMMDQHQDSIDGEKRRQADVEWMESDAQLKNTILKSDQLMQKAAEEYDRRQNNPTNSSPYGQVLLKDMLQTPDTQQWPGDRNTELPLKNPVAMERERELAILTIYQELKQGEVLMEAYDREDAKAVEVTE